MSTSVFADGEWNYAVEVFIRGLYQGCLEREADEAGLSYWYGKITSGEVTGKQAAYGFFYSQDFNAGLSSITMPADKKTVDEQCRILREKLSEACPEITEVQKARPIRLYTSVIQEISQQFMTLV